MSYDQSNNESRDRRTSTTNNPDYGATNSGTGGIAGMGNIDGSVNHYELPNLAQRIKNYLFSITYFSSIRLYQQGA
jgi:hypothetical protein